MIDEKTSCYICYLGENTIEKVELDPNNPTTIGSWRGCDICLNRKFVDKIHAIIAKDSKGYFVQSYKGNNIVYQGRIVKEVSLDETMYFIVGSVKLKFVKE